MYLLLTNQQNIVILPDCVGAASVRGPSLFQNATEHSLTSQQGGTLATCARFYRRENLTRSPAQDSPFNPDACATRPSRRSRTKSFFMT